MTAVDDLAAWLDQVLKADQAAAQAVVDRSAPDEATIYLEDPWPEEAAFLPTVTPARTLARIAADRQILELHGGAHDCQEIRTGTYPGDWPEAASWGTPGGEWRHAVGERFEDEPCPTVRLLALPHANRPGYQEAWRPE